MQNFICFIQQKERGRASIYYHPHLQMISPSPKDFSCDRTQMHPSQAVAKNWDEHTGDTYPHFQAKYVLGLLPRFPPPPPPRPLLWSKAKNFSFKEKQMFCKRQTSFASIFLSALLILLFYCSLSGSPEVGRSGSTSREFKCGPPACWAEGKGRLEGLPCDFQWTLGFWGTMGLPKSTATWWDRCSFSIWVRSPSQEGRRA